MPSNLKIKQKPKYYKLLGSTYYNLLKIYTVYNVHRDMITSNFENKSLFYVF